MWATHKLYAYYELQSGDSVTLDSISVFLVQLEEHLSSGTLEADWDPGDRDSQEDQKGFEVQGNQECLKDQDQEGTKRTWIFDCSSDRDWCTD